MNIVMEVGHVAHQFYFQKTVNSKMHILYIPNYTLATYHTCIIIIMCHVQYYTCIYVHVHVHVCLSWALMS